MARMRWWIVALGLTVGGLVLLARRRGRPAADELWLEESSAPASPDPTATRPSTDVGDEGTAGRRVRADDPSPGSSRGEQGGAELRGTGGAVQLDLSQARTHHLEPVVEFLTYLQEKRGDSSHLLFVRYDDLDDLAERDGAPVEEFLGRLDQLGVVVSQN